MPLSQAAIAALTADDTALPLNTTIVARTIEGLESAVAEALSLTVRGESVDVLGLEGQVARVIGAMQEMEPVDAQELLPALRSLTVAINNLDEAARKQGAGGGGSGSSPRQAATAYGRGR